jgi:hypothetical protein
MEDMIEDIIVDVIVDGRVLGPQEIPPAVSAEIALRLARKETPQEIIIKGSCICGPYARASIHKQIDPHPYLL